MALAHTPVPWEYDYRSALQELIEVLLYAILTGAVATLSVATVAVAFAGRENDLRQLVLAGVESFPVERRFEGVAWLLIYFAVALVAAEAIGNSQFLLRARVMFASMFFPYDEWTHSTVWAWAIEQKARALSPYRRVGAVAQLRNGRVYSGVLGNYPVIGDEKEKDFVLQDVRRLSKGRLLPMQQGTALLLNTRDCVSIQIGALRDPPPGYAPPSRFTKSVQAAMLVLPWAVLVALAGSSLLALRGKAVQDVVIQLLEVFCLQVLAWPTLELIRRNFLKRLDNDIEAQRLWLFAEVALVGAASFVALGEAAQLVVPLLVLSGILIVAAALKATSRTPPPASPQGAS